MVTSKPLSQMHTDANYFEEGEEFSGNRQEFTEKEKKILKDLTCI
jgi:hypothetical protein